MLTLILLLAVAGIILAVLRVVMILGLLLRVLVLLMVLTIFLFLVLGVHFLNSFPPYRRGMQVKHHRKSHN